jgi:hypothetical protein
MLRGTKRKMKRDEKVAVVVRWSVMRKIAEGGKERWILGLHIRVRGKIQDMLSLVQDAKATDEDAYLVYFLSIPF